MVQSLPKPLRWARPFCVRSSPAGMQAMWAALLSKCPAPCTNIRCANCLRLAAKLARRASVECAQRMGLAVFKSRLGAATPSRAKAAPRCHGMMLGKGAQGTPSNVPPSAGNQRAVVARWRRGVSGARVQLSYLSCTPVPEAFGRTPARQGAGELCARPVRITEASMQAAAGRRAGAQVAGHSCPDSSWPAYTARCARCAVMEGLSATGRRSGRAKDRQSAQPYPVASGCLADWRRRCAHARMYGVTAREIIVR